MNGFLGSDLAGAAATWVAAMVTIGVWSYLLGERRLFGLAQHLLAGMATGYLVLIAVREILLPRLLVPLASDPAGHLLLIPALALVAALAGGRWLPRQVPALPVAILVGATAAFALGGAVSGTLLPQLAGSVLRPGTPLNVGNSVIGLAITVLVVLGFLHGVPRGRITGAAAGAGHWLLIGAIGGWLGFLLVSRLSLVVDRLGFLLTSWLGLAR